MIYHLNSVICGPVASSTFILQSRNHYYSFTDIFYITNFFVAPILTGSAGKRVCVCVCVCVYKHISILTYYLLSQSVSKEQNKKINLFEA